MQHEDRVLVAVHFSTFVQMRHEELAGFNLGQLLVALGMTALLPVLWLV